VALEGVISSVQTGHEISFTFSSLTRSRQQGNPH